VQYTAPSFGKTLEEAGIVPSMGRAGSALDNAISESFVASLKTELLYGHRFPSREAARTAVFDYFEGFYNRVRRHSSLGYLSPLTTRRLQWRRLRWRKRNLSIRGNYKPTLRLYDA
jgi:putative transposase